MTRKMEMQHTQYSQVANPEKSILFRSFKTLDCSVPKDDFTCGLGIGFGFQNKTDLLGQEQCCADVIAPLRL